MHTYIIFGTQAAGEINRFHLKLKKTLTIIRNYLKRNYWVENGQSASFFKNQITFKLLYFSNLFVIMANLRRSS